MSSNQDIQAYLRSHLNSKFVGRQLHYYSSVTSTMEVARKLAQEGAADGTTVIADDQTAGRGRLGRSWLSPRGNLAMSVILKPCLDTLPEIIMITSLAVVRAIRAVTGLQAQIKWPNDVLIKGKKVCGILTESEVKGNRLSFVITGIGINVNFSPSAFPEISELATSLSHELTREISRAELTRVLLLQIEQLYLEAQAGAPIYRQWQGHMETLGRWVQVKAGESVQQGKAEAVTKRGNLVLRHADGSLAEIVAGDVTLMIKD